MASPSAVHPTPGDGTLPIDAPHYVDAATMHWHDHCEVLVVGFGAAGAASAIEACDKGADVLICERFDGGGATALSGGVVYAGGGTAYQKAAGYDDTPAAMARYLATEVGDAVSPETLDRFCQESVDLLQWLESLGVPFASEPKPPKTSYPRDGVYLYFSGNEAVPENAAIAAPAPRGHRCRAKGMSGAALYRYLRAAVADRPIRVRTQTATRRLVVDQVTGRVLGVEVAVLPEGSKAARRHRRLSRLAQRVHNVAGGFADRLRAKARLIEDRFAEIQHIEARNGVVLSTGGFIFNRDMVATHAPAYGRNLRLGATGCDGSGIRLGQSVGGQCARLNKVSAWRFINPPSPWPEGLIVDEEGQRFCNEEVYGARLGVRMCEAHGGRAWLIIDRDTRRRAIREALFGKLWAFQSIPALLMMWFAPRARTLAGLALRLKMTTAALEGAAHAMNDAIDQQREDPLGKSDGMRHALREAPFYALNISADNPTFPCPAITLGGLRIDEDNGQVLDADGYGIPGLFAAGRAAVGLASNGYVSGLSLADCFWSGRRAGRSVATLAPALQDTTITADRKAG
ncbi:FAD-binding protein [Algiphilus sp.]|uniref:FAD-binding protein n=1 Tax=Algiphilus sp. TaxID=1872431 RepID=UPI003B51B9C0